jgi:putative ABC transport system permease protein
MIISLRNSIRRKGRLMLTLSTLTLGGAIFIAVFNLWGALGITMQQIEGYFLADVNIRFTRSYRLQKVEDLVMSVPGVVRFEGWKSASGLVLSPDKKSEVEISFLAPPTDSTLINPILTSGRWLTSGDENAVVIGNHLIKERPDLKAGDDIIIKVNDKEHSFHIVGIYKMAGNVTPPILYANPDYLGKITDTPGQVYEARIISSKHDLATQRQIAQTLQTLFKNEGMPVSYVQMGVEWREQQTSQTDVMVYFLLVMALLIALVGGLGLMGTMSMNMMERIREIGIMRAVGASNRDIQGIVVLEGILIGLVSWVAGTLFSIPITYALNYGVGVSMFSSPLDFVFGYQGIIAWLAGVLLLASLSSLLPAWNASRLTIREVLAYE